MEFGFLGTVGGGRRAALLLGLCVAISTYGTGQPALADDELVPPTEKDYECEVVDLDTGLPVEGVWIEANELIDWINCAEYANGTCSNCYGQDQVQSLHGRSDANGRVHVVFQLPYCEPISDDPPLWEKRIHRSWEDPGLWEPGQTEADRWIVGRVERTNGEDIVHRVHLIRESDLIETFAPVLHRHRGRELQADLADLVRSVDDHARLQAFDVTGRRILDSNPPPVHVWDDHYWDSYGSGTQQPFFRLDFDDSVLHDGAPPGERPLYAHAFPYENGVVLQYWLWFQGNDLRQLPGHIGYHEGDWEHLAIYVELDEFGDWIAKQVNLSQHLGGQSLPSEQCWWSATNDPTYLGMTQGFDPERSHLHVWVAANSHALYNRFDPVFTVEVDVPVLCQVIYADWTDYNRGNHPYGDHEFFPYDRLENAGEFERISEDHGESYLWHWSGGPLEYLKFVGWFGEAKCVDVPDCIDFCGIDGLGYTYRPPMSPLLDADVHLWDDFRMESGRWGNPSEAYGAISWETQYLLGDYLGRFATCAEGWGEGVDLPIPAIYGDVPATARFTVISGDLEILDANPYGELPLGLPEDSVYRLELPHLTGTGEGRVDVETQGGLPLAIDVRFDVVPGQCPDPAGIDDTDGPGTGPDALDHLRQLPTVAQAAASIRILGNPSRYGFHVDLGAAPHPWTSWTLHDSAGRRVAQGGLDPHFREIAWSSADEEPLHPGRYFLRLRARTGESRSKPLVVVR